jgi:hypothetical protein
MAVKNLTIAKLDHQNVYQGVKKIKANQLKDDDVEVPENCDLAIGGYVWDTQHKTFIPTFDFIDKLRKSKQFHRRIKK